MTKLMGVKKSADVDDLESTLILGGIRAEMTFLYDMITSIPIPAIRRIHKTNERVSRQGWKAVENARQQDLRTSNIFTGIISQSEKNDGSIREVDAATEAQGMIIAGSGTTAVTLTYLVWAVLRLPDVRQALEAECGKLPPDFMETDLEKLPTTNAVITETLRLYGAAPGDLPRIVPAGGATLGGYYVPEGLTVCTQAYSIHRDPNIFLNPDA